jgi:hypothetical protein
MNLTANDWLISILVGLAAALVLMPAAFVIIFAT